MRDAEKPNTKHTHNSLLSSPAEEQPNNVLL